MNNNQTQTADVETTEIECDVCDERAFIGGEVNERTLEDEGWYLGDISVLCPAHNDEFLAGETLSLKGAR